MPVQNDSLPPNCITLAPTEVPVMLPNVADSILPLGALNDGWFHTLKASARNVKRSRSLNENVLKIERSVSDIAGPRRMLRPMLPYAKIPCAILPGTANALLSMQARRCPPPQLYTGVLRMFGRCGPCALVLAASVFMERLNGVPPCQVMIALACQPPSAVFNTRLPVLKNGIAYMTVPTSRWRISNGALP